MEQKEGRRLMKGKGVSERKRQDGVKGRKDEDERRRKARKEEAQ